MAFTLHHVKHSFNLTDEGRPNDPFMDYGDALDFLNRLATVKDWDQTTSIKNLLSMIDTLIGDGLLPMSTLTELMRHMVFMDGGNDESVD